MEPGCNEAKDSSLLLVDFVEVFEFGDDGLIDFDEGLERLGEHECSVDVGSLDAVHPLFEFSDFPVL